MTVPAPFISCLMVTAGGADRWPRFARSVADYCRQSHPSRELVIVTDEMPSADFAAIRDHCRALGRDDIRLIRPKGKRSLGGLRNLSVSAAHGDVVCQWDDDDVHHPRRLELQAAALGKDGAVFLRDVMHFFEPLRVIYWIHWDVQIMPCHPATLMVFKKDMPRYPDEGVDSRRNEDRNVFLQLRQRNLVSIIEDYPYLYTYVFHGTNTFALAHHLAFLRFAIPDRTLMRHKKALITELSLLNFDKSGVQLMSSIGAIPLE